MADPERVRQARRNLGRSLAAFRRAAGMNQFALAAAVHYTRSTVANVEVGRQNAPLDFWIRCDAALNASGKLREGYDALCLLCVTHAQEVARTSARQVRLTATAPAQAAAPPGPAAAPIILYGSLAGRLAQLVAADTVAGSADPTFQEVPDWDADTLVALTDLGRVEVDVERRRMLGAAAYAVAALALPGAPWWQRMVQLGCARSAGRPGNVGVGDVAAVRDMVALFSRVDQRHGGGHARTAVVQYLASDVSRFLCGRFANDQVRRDMFSAASELAYLAGWVSFDNAEHALALHYFTAAVKLAAEADDPPMAGHVLRAMAHQAVDLGRPRKAAELASASIEGDRYAAASPREKALLGVVHARALSVNGDQRAAATALVRAEDDLAAAEAGDDEPGRVFFFGEASLAHETACALRDGGDFSGAIREFNRSIRAREAVPFARTHAVTLGYLGAVHAQRGSTDEALATWSDALDAMDGVRSGRTRRVAADMRSVLAPLRQQGHQTAVDLDARAARYLAATR
jgi:tetratricopeptide (TPR) repeat protein